MKADNIFCRWFPTWFTPDWETCTLASLWNGNNAQQRMMNMLSPTMSDGKFKDYLNWQKQRGCDTVHLILSNELDGECAGFCIYGSSVDWTVDKNIVNKMLDRIKKCRREGLGVVLWLMTDDSGNYNKLILSDPQRYLDDLEKLGLLKCASIICLGLELSEYVRTDSQMKALTEATRKVWKGQIATHDISNSLKFAGYGDIVFGQVSPSTSDSAMLRFASIVKSTGKPCGIIEHWRSPNRDRCQKLRAEGLPFVGNW